MTTLALAFVFVFPTFSFGFVGASTTLVQKTSKSRWINHHPNLSNEKHALYSQLFGPDEDFDDSLRRPIDNEAEGQVLANKFYEQLSDRERRPPSEDNDQDTGSTVEPCKKKFTGKPVVNEPPDSALLPAERRSQTSRGGRPSPREQMMEREFQLVGRAEQGLKYQAGLAVLCLCLYIFVGLTGGIGSNSDRGDWQVQDDPMVEQLMPVPRDSEASYWI